MRPDEILVPARMTSAATSAFIIAGELGSCERILRARSTGPSFVGASDMVVARRRRQGGTYLCSCEMLAIGAALLELCSYGLALQQRIEMICERGCAHVCRLLGERR